MREIYLPAFEAAVVKGHVDAVMNSYNLVNGVHATQNEFLNLKLLKGEWGFKGVLMSDWDATYDGVAAANNGLDLEMPSPKFMNAKNLLPAVKDGAVKESTIDDKVLRLIRTELRYGFTDSPPVRSRRFHLLHGRRAVALQGALESITLLKNEGHLLPLDPAKIKTIAIIGPDAWPAVPGGGGSSEATPFEPVSTLTGIANLLGPDVHVLYSRGLPAIIDVFRNTKWDGDVKVEAFPSPTLPARLKPPWPQHRRLESRPARAADANAHAASAIPRPSKPQVPASICSSPPPAGEDAFSCFCRWQADPRSGPRRRQVAPIHHHRPRRRPDRQHSRPTICPMALKPGFGFGHRIYEPDLVSADAKQFAITGRCRRRGIGLQSAVSEGESHDRTFTLPWGQDALVEAIAAANPHTIVTLTGGGGMDTRRWLAKVPALLHTWYPGQEGGTAVAEVIFGKHNPEGKLPISFDTDWESNPSQPLLLRHARRGHHLAHHRR